MLFNKQIKNKKILSDNTVKNSLINFDVDFSGLKDIVTYFFPSIRHEIILRYRAETIAKIGIIAYNKAKESGLQSVPIPPKIALPLIEKMSLEHEPDMYVKWANLLIAVSINSNPLHQQYAELLSNLDCHCAIFMNSIYTEQKMKQNAEAVYEQYIENVRFSKIYDDVNKQFSRRLKALGENNLSVSDHFSIYHPFFTFPIILYGSEEDFLYHWVHASDKKENINPDEHKSPCLSLPEKDEKMLLLLVKLGLIKYQELVHEISKENVYIKRYGVLLTEFGYSFIDCLENPIKK
jgi:hypothetical protein